MLNSLKNNKYGIPLLILVGIILGTLSLLSPGGMFFVSLITVGIIVCFKKYGKFKEARFLLILFLVGFFSRVFFVVFTDSFLYLIDKTYKLAGYEVAGLWGDSNYYTIRSQSMFIFRDNPEQFLRYFSSGYGHTGYLYVLELFHILFGFSPTSSKFINCFFGSLNGIIAYAIADHIFNRKAARIAAVLVTFFPSLFLWSVSNLKDTSLLTLVLSSFYIFIQYLEKRNALYLLFLGIFLYLQLHLRGNLSQLLIIAMVIGLSLSFLNTILKKIFFLSIIPIFLWRNLNEFYQLKIRIWNFLNYMLNKHISMALEKGIPYHILSAVYYQNRDLSKLSFIELLIAFFKGWFYFIFSPLPWQIHSISQFLSVLQMFLWYGLLIFALIGFYIGFKKTFLFTFTVMFYIFIMGTLISMADGNIGTLFRHRDMIMPIIIIFSAGAIANLIKREGEIEV